MHQTHYSTRGMTLIELLLVLAIVSILTAVVVPRAASFMDEINVRGAADDAEGLMNTARHLAVAPGGPGRPAWRSIPERGR